jgi:hypothetical protein
MQRKTMNDDAEQASAAHQDETHVMPCAQAMLAGVLALMTGHAQACCDGQRENMAKKIVQNLFMLSRQAGLSTDFRTVAWNLHTRWVQQVHALEHKSDTTKAEPADSVASALDMDTQRMVWHTTPEAMQ